MAALKKKRVSKNKKSAWRKHVDISDVENFLEEQRFLERTGGNLAEKKNEELFSIDTTGLESHAIVPQPKISKVSLRLVEEKTPKCFSLLERRSAVPDPLKKRNPVKLRKVKEKIAKPQTLAKVSEAKTEPNQRLLWNEEDKTRELSGLSDWLAPDTVRNVLHNTGHKNRLRPRSLLNKPSPLLAVESPHPGMSYNPSLADHMDLLQTVAEAEKEEEKVEKHIERVTTKMFRKIPREEAEKAYMTEMSAGIDVSSDSEVDRGEYSATNPPVQRKKKTLQKRRRIREELLRQREAKLRKVEKNKLKDVSQNLRKLKRQIDVKDSKIDAYRKRKNERNMAKKTATKVLSKTKFTPDPLEFQRPSELVGSLRKLAPEGSVLRDRYASLLKRNVLEPAKKRNAKKAAVKRFVKSTHRIESDK